MTHETDVVARIMTIRNGMIVDADAEALIRDALDARQTSPETETLPANLRKRAKIAREEKTITADCDAWYFEQSADEIERLRGHAPTTADQALIEKFLPAEPPDSIAEWFSTLRGHFTRMEHARSGRPRYAAMRAELLALADTSTDRDGK